MHWYRAYENNMYHRGDLLEALTQRTLDERYVPLVLGNRGRRSLGPMCDTRNAAENRIEFLDRPGDGLVLYHCT